jgi:hypothetical protein
MVKASNGAVAEVVHVIVLTPVVASAAPSYAVVVKFIFDNRQARFPSTELAPA